MIFVYGDRETSYLAKKDKRLGAVISAIGPVEREVTPELFPALIRAIVAQQISSKAADTVWARLLSSIGEITPERLAAATVGQVQSCGLSFRKTGYIKNAAEKIIDGKLDIEALSGMTDDEVFSALCALDGIGVWTAEMLMLFSMQRPDILSYGDLAIRRGLRMLYHHREITPELYRKYKRRYSPYASVASLYLWAIAGGAVAGMKDKGH